MTAWLLSATLVAAAGIQDRTGRDIPVTPDGTAVISGVVTTDAQKPQPMRRARVTLRSSELNVNRTIVTDETGRFSFQRVPAGKFLLSAAKEAFIDTAYGARRPGGAGIPVVVMEGAQLTGLTLRLPRGAVITGVVTDTHGQPFPDVQISAFVHGFVRGERQLIGRAAGRTDDRGAYRLYGLAPGRYFVLASAQRPLITSVSDVLAPSEGEIDKALQALDRPTTTTSVAGVGRPAGYSPLYYPGAVMLREATALELTAGQERTGVDLQLSLVANGRVEGTVVGPEDIEGVVQTTLTATWEGGPSGMDGFRSGRANADGTFSFGSVSPGEYLVTARATRAGGVADSALGAATSVVVTADAATAVTLELGRGFTVRGRVAFDGAAPPTPMRGWRIGIAPTQTRSAMTLGSGSGEIQPDGSFAITGVMPGNYRIIATPPAAYADAWMARAVTANDRDVLDGAVDVSTDLHNVFVTYTNRVAQVSGTLQTAAGTPAAEYNIIVFPKDSRLWTPHSSRIHAVRPATDGGFVVKRLPPGEYLLATVLDVEAGEWLDPAFLQRLTTSALALALAEGEQKVQNLTLR